MGRWESKTVDQVVSGISNNEYVLPVIQRRLVWDDEKMGLLFDTLLKGNSFGGIMVILEEKGNAPLFAFRHFTKDGAPLSSIRVEKLLQNQLFVIDGQQRLQTFYIGLLGSLEGRIVYFDLLSDYEKQEFDFRFANDPQRLPSDERESDGTAPTRKLWYSVESLYHRLKFTEDDDQVVYELKEQLGPLNDSEQTCLARNVRAFYRAVFGSNNIGLCTVSINRSLEGSANRQRIVELFRRLNDGGTRLSSFELVAAILKGFEWEMEQFLDDVIREYVSIGITQDTLIKLLFILRDDHAREMSDIQPEDAKFAVDNRLRISKTLKVLTIFLENAKLKDFYSSGNPSTIPLYFLAYHIFHKNISTDKLETLFTTFDTTDTDYRAMYQWVYWSLLNGLFKSRGAGWIPYRTGIKKILEVMKKHKNRIFPVIEIFQMYRRHGLTFTTQLKSENLDVFDRTFLFYLIYDRSKTPREQDIDHIHPYNLLYWKTTPEKMNSIVNFQLLDVGTNRGAKQGKPLDKWIKENVTERKTYLTRHLIPEDETYWSVDKFDQFLLMRQELILKKVGSVIT